MLSLSLTYKTVNCSSNCIKINLRLLFWKKLMKSRPGHPWNFNLISKFSYMQPVFPDYLSVSYDYVFTDHFFPLDFFLFIKQKLFLLLWKELMLIISIMNASLNIDWLASFSSCKLLIGLFEFNKKTRWNSLILKLFLTACYWLQVPVNQLINYNTLRRWS